MNASAPDKPSLYGAVALTDQLSGLRGKHQTLQAQAAKEAELSPEQQRERLLTQVKADNQEIAGLERKYGRALLLPCIAFADVAHRM